MSTYAGPAHLSLHSISRWQTARAHLHAWASRRPPAAPPPTHHAARLPRTPDALTLR